MFTYLITLFCLMGRVEAISTDNTCTFKSQGKLFTLTLLNRNTEGNYYRKRISTNSEIVFNFCTPFLPKECINPLFDTEKAYSFIVSK